MKRHTGRKVDVSPLAQKLHFEFSGRTAPNRFMKAAMTERLSSWSPTDLPARGVPSKELINVYRRWGEGGYGVILSGNILLFYDQLEASGNPIIALDNEPAGPRFEAYKELITEAKKHGSLYVAQLSHPGRQTPTQLQTNPVSASDVQLEGEPMGMRFSKPHAASVSEIKEITAAFAHAASYLEQAGADGIQLHGAHGYLLAQFLAPSTNKRTDSYGGSLENRARLIIEIAQAVRAVTRPDFIVGIKLNSVEFQAGGLQPAEAAELCKILERERFDFIELSGGTYEALSFKHRRESTVKREAFFLEFADSIAPALSSTKSYITGGLKSAGAMVDALKTVDGIGLGRPAAQEFHLPKDILEGKVDAAIEQVFDQDDTGLTIVVAGAQIRQVGKDQEPFDGSNPDSAQIFQQDLKKWMDEVAADKEMKRAGFADLEGFKFVPYGAAAAVEI